MEHVTGVNVMVQSLLYQVLGFESCELRHSGSTAQESEKTMSECDESCVASSLSTSDLVSKKMSFKSRLARNMNMLLKSLISVMPLGGREWPTATRPTVW